MKERPILMSGPMVRAILAGAKTQTRRILKPQPEAPRCIYDDTHASAVMLGTATRGRAMLGTAVGFAWRYDAEISDGAMCSHICPYGQPGDRLVVLETWATSHRWDRIKPSELPPGDPGVALYYRATDDSPALTSRDGGIVQNWRPSIFMPRWASRITLEVESVRVERLNEISEADAWAEGIKRTGFTSEEWQRHLDGDASVLVASVLHKDGFWENFPTARHAYARLWESINGKGSWAANPWVWVIELRRIP